MKWWHSRYIICGVVFVVSFIGLARSLPTIECLLEQSAGVVVGLTALAIPAIGFLIYSLFYLLSRIWGGAGLFVDHRRLRSGMVEVFGKCDQGSRSAEVAKMAKGAKDILDRGGYKLWCTRKQSKSKERMGSRNRTVYWLIWHWFGPKELREGCHTRWESYHVSGGIALSLLLATILWFLLASSYSDDPGYFRENAKALIAIGVIVSIALVHAIVVGVQVGRQENLWIELFLNNLKSNCESFFQGAAKTVPLASPRAGSPENVPREHKREQGNDMEGVSESKNTSSDSEPDES